MAQDYNPRMVRNARCALRAAITFWGCVAAAYAADLRLGIIGTDTSHVVEFTKMLNDADSPEHVPGARVIAAFKGGSSEMPESYKRVDRFANELRTRWNIQFVPDIASLCPKVDAVMLESLDGRQHLEQVKQAAACGKPLWIDKPLASSLAAAKEIVRVTREAGVPWFSASSLRFSQIATSVKVPKLSGAITWGAGPLGPGDLDLAWYAIHTIELLYAVMGPGCEESRAFIRTRQTSSLANGSMVELARFTRCDRTAITARWYFRKTGSRLRRRRQRTVTVLS